MWKYLMGILVLCGGIFCVFCGDACRAGDEGDGKERVTVHPRDNDAAMLNPGMGWVFHHYDNAISGYGEPLGTNYDGREFPGLTVVYLRLAWSFLEPEEGKYQWPVLDSVIQRYERMGIRFAFRFTVFEGNQAQDGVPQWLRDAGCPGSMVHLWGQDCWEVDYASPMFLEKWERFLMAVGKRYGNHPNLDFVDIGSLGIWGEGHPIAGKYSPDVLKKHIELHKLAFPHTWLVANDDLCHHLSRDLSTEARDEILQLILDEGLTLRDDSLNVYADPKLHYSADLAERFWRNRPVILEMGHYDYAKENGAWGGERYLQAVEDYHASYVSVHANPVVFLKENAELIQQINRRLGYRLQLTEASWNASVNLKGEFIIDSVWKNAAVAPCLQEHYVIWTLMNDHGDLCAVFADEHDRLHELGPEETWSFHSVYPIPPTLHPGNYTLCVSVGTKTGTPQMMLPYHSCVDEKLFIREYPKGKRNDIDSLRYPIGKITFHSDHP